MTFGAEDRLCNTNTDASSIIIPLALSHGYEGGGYGFEQTHFRGRPLLLTWASLPTPTRDGARAR